MKLFEPLEVTGRDGQKLHLHTMSLDGAKLFMTVIEKDMQSQWFGRGRLSLVFDPTKSVVSYDKNNSIRGLTFNIYVRYAEYDRKTKKSVSKMLPKEMEAKIADAMSKFNEVHKDSYIGISKYQTKKDGTELQGRNAYLSVPFDMKSIVEDLAGKKVDLNKEFTEEEALQLLQPHIEQYENRITNTLENFAKDLGEISKATSKNYSRNTNVVREPSREEER